LSVRAAANVRLSHVLRGPVPGAATQLTVGFLLLFVVTALAGGLGALARLPEAPPWHLLGGLGSAVYITAGIVLFPRLGALVTVGLFITGQMLASLVLDSFGLLGVPIEPLGLATLLGVLAVLVGAGLIVRAQHVASPPASTAVAVPVAGESSGNVRATAPGPGVTNPAPGGSSGSCPARRSTWWGRAGWLVLALAGGAVLPVQAAVNARLRADLAEPLAVATFSFLIATVAMCLVLVGSRRAGTSAASGWPALREVPWWGWLGGLVGASYVTSMFLLVPYTGVAPAIALTVAGQQVTSALVDHYGWLRLPQRPVARHRLLGVGVLLVGVALLQLF
jgi:bacterial/archaeal transporter family-2 protein